MTVVELKKWIYENKKIEYVLESLECKNIKYNSSKDYYSASFSNGDNPSGILINNSKYLNFHSYSRTGEFKNGSDLITLVEYEKKASFIDAVKYLHDIFGLDYNYINVKKKQEVKKEFDPLEVFKRIQTRRRINVDEIHYLDDKIMDDFVPLPYIGWIREGIMPWTCKKFGIAYSYRRKRIIIPHFHWLTGKLMGFNARTTIENCEEFGIRKYILTHGLNKSLNLYGYWQNKDEITKKGYCVLYEGEKSVLKRDSRNDSTGLALSGKHISDEQIRILIGLDVDILIALDKDVSIQEVRYIAERLWRQRNVYYLYDKYDLLGDKDSPADATNKVFNFLVKHKVKYDEIEHNLYLKELGRK